MTKQPPKKTKAKTAIGLTSDNIGYYRPRDEPRGQFRDHLDTLMALQKELIPFSTACDSLRLPAERVAGWVARYPAIRDSLKAARAAGLIDLQRKVAGGTPGWQALMRLAESADPENWIRPAAAGRAKSDRSPYAAALTAARRK